MRELDRRGFVRGTGVALVGGTLAGCTGNGNGNGNGDGDVPQEIDDFLQDAQLYDGTIVDETGSDEVTVDVGAGDMGLAFDPPAVRVDAGSTVVWEWTGEGGDHNVASTDDSDTEFESEMTAEAGHTFEETFEEAGHQLYQCDPHAGNGMLGAVDVVEE